MCFSPEASFAGGVIISSIGVATIRKVHKPTQIIFACIPLFFGIQQIAEGFLWLTLPLPEYLTAQKLSAYIFLVMALVIWPTMIPLSVLYMEENMKRRKILWIFLALGVSLSLYYTFCLISFSIDPQVMRYHVEYNTGFPESPALMVFTAYLVATITPLFASSVQKIHLMGLLMFISCCVTVLFFTQFLTSVWCFFAALISVVVYWIIRESKIQFNFNRLKFLEEKLKLIRD
jgi:hypothetical protein